VPKGGGGGEAAGLDNGERELGARGKKIELLDLRTPHSVDEMSEGNTVYSYENLCGRGSGAEIVRASLSPTRFSDASVTENSSRRIRGFGQWGRMKKIQQTTTDRRRDWSFHGAAGKRQELCGNKGSEIGCYHAKV